MAAVGLLSGTFDPIHLGHVELAKAAMSQCGLDEVWFMVNPDPGHKQGTAPVKHRAAMVRLALAEGMKLYDGPSAAAAHEPAVFRAVMNEQPSNTYVFIVGADTLVRLDTWQDVQSVVTLTTYAVARRSGTDAQAIDDLRHRLGRLGGELQVQWFDFDDHGAASSRLIRQAIEQGRPPQSLDPRVFEYIQAHRLYR
jgi:nicotinate-nucleotide adenylyltransferase